MDLRRSGNDIFYAGSGNSVLVGGSGTNTLVSGRGYNLLIAGSGGGNEILGTQGDNIEIAGSTNYDANETALAAILAEWSTNASPANYDVRVHAVALEMIALGMTITPGAGCDSLYGGSGEDTYFAQTKLAQCGDYIYGLKSSELVTQI